MYTKADAAQLILSYSIIASSFVNNTSEDVFDWDDFKNIEQLPRDILDKLIPYCDYFIGIIKGYVNECEIRGFIRTMSFPKRFLKLETVDELPKNQKEEVERKLEHTFFLGLIFHFFVWDAPTRKNFDEVNLDNLIKGWFSRTLLADKHCKSSNKQANRLAQSFFRYYYDRSLEPFFQDDLKFGYLKRGECFAYFHNLFYAGVQLGVHFDLKKAEKTQPDVQTWDAFPSDISEGHLTPEDYKNDPEVTTGTITLDSIRKHWPEIITSLKGKGKHRNLDAFVRVSCEPIEYNDGTLTIGVYHEFHLQYMQEYRNQKLLVKKISEILKMPVKLQYIRIDRRTNDSEKS